jgi:hypothetical protein
MQICGGYISLAFFKSGSTDPTRAFLPAVSYYDASVTSLKFSYAKDPNFNFAATLIANKKQGLYSQLFFSGSNQDKINIYYYDRNNNMAKRYSGTLTWSSSKISKSAYAVLADGGREVHVAISDDGDIAYTTLNESAGTLRVEFV